MVDLWIYMDRLSAYVASRMTLYNSDYYYYYYYYILYKNVAEA